MLYRDYILYSANISLIEKFTFTFGLTLVLCEYADLHAYISQDTNSHFSG